MRVDFGNVRELFTGDIDSTIEATIVARQTPVTADVLKVAHHGSAYSSSAVFLAAVQPHVAVISVGPNSYGHPSPDTISRLQSAGGVVYRTDQSGNITVSIDGTSYSVSSDQAPIPIPISLGLYLPLVMSAPPAPTPTPVPQPTQEPGPAGNVQITYIFYDGVVYRTESDEYVEIKNLDISPVQLSGWTLRDDANHVYTFPSFSMQSNRVCRVYTNEYHPDSCGFSYGSGSAIWNNTGDCAYLRDGGGNLRARNVIDPRSGIIPPNPNPKNPGQCPWFSLTRGIIIRPVMSELIKPTAPRSPPRAPGVRPQSPANEPVIRPAPRNSPLLVKKFTQISSRGGCGGQTG